MHVSLHDGLLLRGSFVAFDRVMNHVLHLCVELYHQEGRHALGPFLLPNTTIVSMMVEALPYSPPTHVVNQFTTSPISPSGGSMGVPLMALESRLEGG
jgi:small nuclear ribonucleoprotein (snRNP)-like protein